MDRGDIAPLPSSEHPPVSRIVFRGARSPGPPPARRALRRPRCVSGRDVRGERCRAGGAVCLNLGLSGRCRRKFTDKEVVLNDFLLTVFVNLFIY